MVSGAFLSKLCFSTNQFGKLGLKNNNNNLQHTLSWFPPEPPRSPGKTSLVCSNLNT